MGIVSYAQNCEDVMLWRALQDVKNGFYIDIGANDPISDSVTKAFYENGWNGINIEPELELFELLENDRPRDINLNIAISSKVKSIEFYKSSIRGWSTTDKESFANLKEKDSFVEIRTVQAITLDKLCEDNKIEEVHFLKVDVEGAEKDVLESFSFNAVRPWICIVEATKPTTQIDVSCEWEDILLNNDYIFAYFDGLNKYYVSSEHSELIEVLKIPPNVFDEFIRSDHRNAIVVSDVEKNKAHEWWLKASEAEAKAHEAEAKAHEWWLKATNAEDRYNSILNSKSFKFTKPLRSLYQFLHKGLK